METNAIRQRNFAVGGERMWVEARGSTINSPKAHLDHLVMKRGEVCIRKQELAGGIEGVPAGSEQACYNRTIYLLL